MVFIHRINNFNYLFKLKDISDKYKDEKFHYYNPCTNKQYYTFYKNPYPRWFSCFGGLNFDYDYYTKDIDGKNKKYYKISETSNTLTLVSTRNNNGWIVEGGWIDSVRGFFCDLHKKTKSFVTNKTTEHDNKLEQSNLLEISDDLVLQDKEEEKKEEENTKEEEEEIGQKNNNRWIDSFYDFFGGLNCCNCKNIESEINNDEEVEQYI